MTKVKITSDKNEHRASPALTHLERSPSLAFLLTLNLTMTLDNLQTGLESSKKLQLTNEKKRQKTEGRLPESTKGTSTERQLHVILVQKRDNGKISIKSVE